jgi:branched-chain amino acid aminotransferase
MATVFINGRIIDTQSEPATVSAFDAGLQHGVGVFETMLGGCDETDAAAEGAAGAWCLHLEEHLERLRASALAVGLVSALHPGPLAEAVLRTIQASGQPRARVRLTITGGDLNLLNRPMAGQRRESGGGAGGAGGAGGSGWHDPTVIVAVTPATRYPAGMLEEGVLATIADTRVSPLDELAPHKTLNYWFRLRELQAAAGKGAGEALVFTTGNHLVGGCVSSAILVRDGELVVPIALGEEADAARGVGGVGGVGARAEDGRALRSPVRPGITRAWAIQTAAGLGHLTRRKMVTIDDVLSADELMLTNSSWGVLPVVQVESRRIGGGGGGASGAGVPGPITRALLAAWREESRA